MSNQTHNSNGNGKDRILWWIITMLTGFCSALGGHQVAVQSTTERISIVEHDLACIKSDISDIKHELRQRNTRHEDCK